MSRVRVTAESVAKLAGDVEGFGGRLRQIADAAEAALAPRSSAWGDDKFGSKFATEGKFDKSATTMRDNTRKIADTFDNLAEGLADAARGLRRAERASTSQF
ncbi:PE domain-containing protein [Nocardia higoensis]|uniref:PE domain-containing protein n=1 Tax=Nocardia higoensis TaxID=228599 RepID=A0ABS0DCG1_9NOCA|nr:PE domain-containing protein [Nocardia higoensis]MBF6356145.1 PE domain-containing protein [Nocardia higoensis]